MNMKALITTILLGVYLSLGCGQTIHLKFRWDKNTEPDIKEYHLFADIAPDSADLFNMWPKWPDDSLDAKLYDDSLHSPHRIAVIGHVFGGVDSLTYEWDQRMSQNWLRGYIFAADSAGNYSFIAPSENVVDIGDREAPAKPKMSKTYISKE